MRGLQQRSSIADLEQGRNTNVVARRIRRRGTPCVVFMRNIAGFLTVEHHSTVSEGAIAYQSNGL